MTEYCFSRWAGHTEVQIDGQPVTAQQLGLSDEMFHEWREYMGQPRCGGFRKNGERCNFAPVGWQCVPEFVRQHRVVICHLHKKNERRVLDGGCVLLQPTAFR